MPAGLLLILLFIHVFVNDIKVIFFFETCRRRGGLIEIDDDVLGRRCGCGDCRRRCAAAANETDSAPTGAVDDARRGWQSRAPFSASEIAIFEHFLAVWVECPVIAFTGFPFLARDFEKAIVETQIVANGILPTLLVLLVVREFLHDEFVDA